MAAPHSLIVTVLGPDRPGLVESVAEIITRNGGNWIESRLIELGGQFAGVIRVEAPDSELDALQGALEAHDLVSTLRRVETRKPDPGLRRRLELVGPDRPGIVQELARAFAALGINIEELETECISAPWTGEPLFQARIELRVPSPEAAARLHADLETLENDLTLEIDLLEMSSPSSRV